MPYSAIFAPIPYAAHLTELHLATRFGTSGCHFGVVRRSTIAFTADNCLPLRTAYLESV